MGACTVKSSVKKVCKATWKREFKLPWREAGSSNHLDDKVDLDQLFVTKELSLCRAVAPEAGSSWTTGVPRS